MPTRIVCSFINPPKPGKTNGSIRVKSGEFYGVKPDMLSLFQAEQAYDIEFTSRQFNGQAYNTVTSAKHVQEAPRAAAGNSSGGKYGNQDMATAERIFVCGALNAMIHGGHVEVSQVYISNVVNVLRASWAETFGAGQPPKFDNPDMGDNEGIPF